jgi:DNA-binding NtrC family response regulator
MERSPAALVCDKESSVRDLIRHELEERGILTHGAESGAEALQILSNEEIELLFVDLEAAAAPVAGLMARIGTLDPKPLVIGLLSSEPQTDCESSLDAGLFDLLFKPLRAELLGYRLERALRHLELLAATERLRGELREREGLSGLVGRSVAMERLRKAIDRHAASECCVWFTGEEGSGKRLAARMLHARSARATQRFIALDTFEEQQEPGERMKGTLYLAEVTALPLDQQDRLLKVLSSQQKLVADETSLPSPGPRILAGSSRDPRQVLGQGLLLPALHERLAERSLRLPPLRERPEDIAPLAQHFVSAIRRMNKLPPIRISEEALVLLEAYRWPGNVRELRNAMERAVILAVEGAIQAHDLPRSVRAPTGRYASGDAAISDRTFKAAKQEMVRSFERSYLTELLERFEGNVTVASRHAGMLRSALQRLLRKYGLKSAAFRKRLARSGAHEGAEKALE